MRAAVIYEHGSIENIMVEENYPEPAVKPDWVKVQVKACSLNYHDIFTRRGMPGIKIPLPLIIGSDIAGIITELGQGVTSCSVGQRVLIDPVPSPQNGNLMVGEQYDGGRAEYCVAHESHLIPIPDSVSFESAASIPLAYGTAHRMLITRGKVRAGETVLVLGASGGVGTGCVLLAKMKGAKVIACAGSKEKLQRLHEIGADYCIDYSTQNVRDAVWDIVGKPRRDGAGGVEVVVNSTGGGTWPDSIRALKLGGRLVTCGATAGYEEKIDVRYLWTFEHTILGSNGCTRSDMTTLLDYCADGTFSPVIDKVFDLKNVQEAERMMEQRKVFGKILITP